MATLAERMERLELQRQRLLMELTEVHSKWEKLQDAARARQRPRVASARAHFEGELSEAERLQLQQALKPLLDDFVGKEIQRLDPVVVANVFRDREIDLGGRSYRLRLTLLILAEELHVYFEVEKTTSPAGGL